MRSIIRRSRSVKRSAASAQISTTRINSSRVTGSISRRIISIVTGLEYEDADALLKRAHWNVKAAIVMQKTGLTLPKAVARLRKSDDFVRDAIGEDAEARLKELLNVE